MTWFVIYISVSWFDISFTEFLDMTFLYIVVGFIYTISCSEIVENAIR